MTLTDFVMDVEDLRRARTLPQEEVDRITARHDLDDFTPDERLPMELS